MIILAYHIKFRSDYILFFPLGVFYSAEDLEVISHME